MYMWMRQPTRKKPSTLLKTPRHSAWAPAILPNPCSSPRPIAASLLPDIAAMLTARGIEIRGCDETRALVANAKPASEEDYATEFLAAIISCKVVTDLDEAMNHINRYSSGHTEAIITENYTAALRFLREVDSASVIVNASTRFADGFEYGLGAEIGISTDKFHARGPVGLEGLTSQKVDCAGQRRSPRINPSDRLMNAYTAKIELFRGVSPAPSF